MILPWRSLSNMYRSIIIKSNFHLSYRNFVRTKQPTKEEEEEEELHSLTVVFSELKKT